MEKYVQSVLLNIERGSQQPLFTELVSSIDTAYQSILAADAKHSLLYYQFLFICHKSLLSAAVCLAQGQPEDSLSISRRAIECAKVALAIKLDKDSADKWLSFQERHERWVRRGEGEKPQRLIISYPALKGNLLAEQLNCQLGILSDEGVHFTPEFFGNLYWVVQREPSGDGEIRLNYFHNEDKLIESNVISLAAIHGLILKVFDQ